MMTENTQLWKFRCASCGEMFDIEVSHGQRPADFARAKACPSCHRLPGTENPWHRLVGFQSRRTPPYPRNPRN